MMWAKTNINAYVSISMRMFAIVCTVYMLKYFYDHELPTSADRKILRANWDHFIVSNKLSHNVSPILQQKCSISFAQFFITSSNAFSFRKPAVIWEEFYYRDRSWHLTHPSMCDRVLFELSPSYSSYCYSYLIDSFETQIIHHLKRYSANSMLSRPSRRKPNVAWRAWGLL
jgi:hypothetical protein